MYLGYPSGLRIRLNLKALTVVALVSLLAACTSAQSRNYRFDVVDQPVAVGAHSEFEVRLTEVATGQPVSNATISNSALDMTHYRPRGGKGTPRGGGRVPMPGEVKFIGPGGPGLYRFMGDVSMPGKWKLTVSADVPGESELVDGTATFEASRQPDDSSRLKMRLIPGSFVSSWTRNHQTTYRRT